VAAIKNKKTLRKISNELVLTAREWKGEGPSPGGGELVATQIVEDFAPREYFLRIVGDVFGDAERSESGAELKLTWAFSQRILESVLRRLNTLASPDRYGRVGENYTDLIGNTPLLRLKRLAAGCKATVLVKLECMEPNSVKDRPVFSILQQAIERGEITADSEVVEASSGNVAFALSAILKSMMDRKPKIFMSKMHGEAKIRAVRVSGCPVVLTSKAEGTASAKRASVAYAEAAENVFQVNQHGNPDNARAHRLTTGPEIYHQTHVLTGQAPAEFVTGIGSGGTAVGVGLFREDIGADFKVIGVEPAEASLLTGGDFAAHRFSGLAPGFVPKLVQENRHLIEGIETVAWQDGFAICRRMLIEEGLLVGASTGASVAAALRRANLPENEGKVIVTIAHDRGDRYLGIKDLFVPPAETTQQDAE